MHISRVLIKGFRSIKQCDLVFRQGKNILIGKNSSGKTNIVAAIDILFGERHPTRFEIQEGDFYLDVDTGERERKISIFARLEGDDLDERTLLQQRGLWVFPISGDPVYKEDDSLEIGQEIFSEIEALSYANTSWEPLQKRYVKAGTQDLANVIEMIKRSPVYYFVFQADAESGYRDVRSDFRFVFIEPNTKKCYVIANMQYNFREAFSNSAIMPAFRDPYLQMKIVNYNWYGKLLKQTWEKASQDADILEGMSEIIKKISEVGSPIFEELTKDLNNKLNVGFGGAKIRFQFINSSKQDMHRNVKVYVDDGIDDIITRKGSGIQSAFLIGLFTYYCLLNHNTSILVIEEPEVFLHPHARRSISRRLDEFVRLKIDEGKTNQVIVTTHSDDIVQTGGVETISLIRKGASGTESKTFIFNDDFDQKEVRGILKSRASEMLFADKALICEGAEEFLLPRIADIMTSSVGYFDDANISMISSSGKGTVATMSRILDKLGIKWYAVVDFDFIDHTAKRFLNRCGRTFPELEEKIERFHVKAQTVLGRNLSKIFKGQSLESLPSELRGDAEEIIELFKDNLGIWILKRGTFENYITQYGEDNLFNDDMKVDPSKLISVCLDIDMNVEDFFETDEFQAMLTELQIVS